MSLRTDIGSRIREVRESQDVTRQALADALGVAYQRVANIEYGSVGVSMETLYALAEALDVHPRELLPD